MEEKNSPTTNMHVYEMGRVESDIVSRTKDPGNASADDFAFAKHDLWCEILKNSSFFTEDENVDSTCFEKTKVFSCKAGKIEIGLDPYEGFSPSVWSESGDYSCITLLYSQKPEKFAKFLRKAFNEYYDTEIFLKFLKFKDDYFSYLFVSDNEEDVEKAYDLKAESKHRKAEKILKT